MGLMKRLDRASAMVDGMAERLGVDLGATSTMDADRAAYGYRDMVMRCLGCDDKDACAALQAGHHQLQAPPAFCRNHSRFNR